MTLSSARAQLLVMLAATIAIGVVAEAGLRTADLRFDATFYVADPQLGWALRPGIEGWFVSEGRQFIRINSNGMRAREFAIPKPPGTVRIAVLGNSWTEALQVPLDETFCSVLERRLSGAPCVSGRRVEVLNFGVSGYATAQELIQLRTRVWKFQPDLVLLAFYTARDILNNVREFNNAADPGQSPYFRFAGNRLVLDSSFRNLPQFGRSSILTQKLRFDVADHCRLLQSTNYLVRLLRVAAAKATLSAKAPAAGQPKLENIVYAPPASPTIANAWKITEGLLSLMRDEVAGHGAEFLVVTLANRAQTHPDVRVRRRLEDELGVQTLDYADDRVRAFGASAGIPVTSLAHRLEAYAVQTKAYLNGFPNTAMGEGHWNELGHRLAGEAMADDVASLLEGRREAGRAINPSLARR